MEENTNINTVMMLILIELAKAKEIQKEIKNIITNGTN